MLNLNAPGTPPEEVRRTRVTRLGRRLYDDRLVLEDDSGPLKRYRIYGENPSWRQETGTDFAAVEAGELSVTPLHFDLTDIDGMDALERWQLDALLEWEAAPAERP